MITLESLQWPVCLECYPKLGRPPLAFQQGRAKDGPHPLRIEAGILNPDLPVERCSACGAKTTMGAYLKDPPQSVHADTV